MSDGFRKSLFGFNCDDVIEYIKKTHSDFSQKETVMNEKIEDLTSSLSASNRQLEDLRQENERLTSALKEYEDKEQEIKDISEKIGRLYLVSQANAKAIIENAEENRRLSNEEVEKNLDSLKKAHEALSGISESVSSTCEDFTEKMQSLSMSLEETEKKLDGNDAKSAESSEVLKLVKENLA